MSKKTGGVARGYVDGFFVKSDEVDACGAKLQPKEVFRDALQGTPVWRFYMPIYEFECEACHHRGETIARSKDEQISCPNCGSGKTRRLLSSFNAPGGEKSASHAGGGCSCCPSAPSCPKNFNNLQ